MSQKLENVESIRPKREIKGWLSLPDFIFIIVVTVISFFIRGIVFPLFEIPFVIFTFLNAVFLVKPPKENPKQKNYNMLWLILRRYFFKEYLPFRSIDVREFK
ncbi:DUF5592 family protein [Enterococcus rivorum]|uniref:Uncharacterized protein n=1 Tax=Enterococcus rivorum TaxID=762845 RepID=A0A1E5L0E4_9ENTE|nr:DUF5592 family protein [Enterococcus rivorum]MBP2098810.1 hypothetical protein [Enterococcus rivorum]OEH83544.1 hypothetical protein BCR26_08670 [Enterococcus rivorum]